MSDEQLPRVWMGDFQGVDSYWWWLRTENGLEWKEYTGIDAGDIFVPGHLPKPTIDPAEMKTIATAKEVDWT